jgi:hypothetical protein
LGTKRTQGDHSVPNFGEEREAREERDGHPRKPILVTGSHRSGTTWIGRTLTRSPRLAWVAEPFHPRHRRGVFGARFPHWFMYLCDDNAGPWVDDLEHLMHARYRWGLGARDIRRPVDAAMAARDAGRFLRRRLTHQRPLIKDPIALFSTPWLAERFDMDVVLMVRHPAAFAWSLIRLDWRFDLANWLDQPLLLRDLIGPWEDDIRRLHERGREGRTAIEEAALLWSVMYGVADCWRAQHPDWRFLRHEDISADPRRGFADLCAALAVPFDVRISDMVETTTAGDNPVVAPANRAHALQRDSRANRRAWVEHLGPGDIDTLRELTAPVAARWYAPEDW